MNPVHPDDIVLSETEVGRDLLLLITGECAISVRQARRTWTETSRG